jgi:hypothetical protein
MVHYNLLMRKTSRIMWVLVLGLFAFPAIAYIPSANFLLEKLAQVRGKQNPSRAQYTLRCQGESSVDSHEERLLIKTPGMVRRERGSDVVDICQGMKCWQRQGAAKAIQLPEWAFLQYVFFTEKPSGGRYQSLLTSLKVKTEETTLARFHGKVAYVIGAKEWERDRPQLWVDKDSYLPLRMYVLDGKSLIDIGWFGWGGRTGGERFPSEIELGRDGKVFERCELTDINTTLKIPDDLFKI